MNNKTQKIITIAGTLFSVLIPAIIWYYGDPETAVVHLLFSSFLLIYYFSYRKKTLKKLDVITIVIILSIFATDVTNLNLAMSQWLVLLSLLFTSIYVAGYIFFLRLEKIRITLSGIKDVIRSLIPYFIFFSTFGLFFLDHPSGFEHILILILDLGTTLLIILSFFRHAALIDFYAFAIGTLLFLGIINILHLLIKIKYLPSHHLITMIVCYWLSHFLLIHSIQSGLNKAFQTNS